MRGKLWPMASPCLVVTSLLTCCFPLLSFITYIPISSLLLLHCPFHFSSFLTRFFSCFPLPLLFLLSACKFLFLLLFSSTLLVSFHPIKSSFTSSSGSGIGTFILAPVVQLLIEQYSWRGALLILGGFVSNLCVCGALMKPLEPRGGER